MRVKGQSAPGENTYSSFYTTALPQRSSHANSRQRAILNAAHVVPSPGSGLCAEWVARVFDRCGYGNVHKNADEYYWSFCRSSNQAELKVGMAIAVPSHSHTIAGSKWGHVCIYIGDGKVMDNVGRIRTIGLDDWLTYYRTTYTPKWGWYRNMPLV